MVGHGGGLLQRPSVLQVSRDAGRPEGMVADLGLDAGHLGAPADHVRWTLTRPNIFLWPTQLFACFCV